MVTSFYQMALGIIRGKSYPLMPPVSDMSEVWTEQESAAIQNMMAVTFVGSKETVAGGLEELIKYTGVNELMITTNIYDHEARLKSFQITAEVMKEINRELVN